MRRGLLAQLVNSLVALGVERLETQVACGDFGPSQRLALRKAQG